jgi:hypothetical protein
LFVGLNGSQSKLVRLLAHAGYGGGHLRNGFRTKSSSPTPTAAAAAAAAAAARCSRIAVNGSGVDGGGKSVLGGVGQVSERVADDLRAPGMTVRRMVVWNGSGLRLRRTV